MLKITVELIPHGEEEYRTILDVMTIVNDGSGTLNNGNYNYYLSKEGTRKVSNFPRLEKDAWDLIKECLLNREMWKNL